VSSANSNQNVKDQSSIELINIDKKKQLTPAASVK